MWDNFVFRSMGHGWAAPARNEKTASPLSLSTAKVKLWLVLPSLARSFAAQLNGIVEPLTDRKRKNSFTEARHLMVLQDPSLALFVTVTH